MPYLIICVVIRGPTSYSHNLGANMCIFFNISEHVNLFNMGCVIVLEVVMDGVAGLDNESKRLTFLIRGNNSIV